MPKNEWEIEANKTYRAIGRFIFEFSQVEYTIRHNLGQQIGLDEKYFTAVIESYDVGLLCTVAKQVFGVSRNKKNGLLIKKLLDKFMELNGVRIRVAHGLWNPSDDGGSVSHVSRSNLKPNQYLEQAKALEKEADKLNQLRAELDDAFTSW
jgi:hypothetical protein